MGFQSAFNKSFSAVAGASLTSRAVDVLKANRAQRLLDKAQQAAKKSMAEVLGQIRSKQTGTKSATKEILDTIAKQSIETEETNDGNK